ncbi:MAG TPA: hypothetical protein VK184_10885 [Nostocaceae cyanobacterium]|nr:hypothetical protein [Nostocaceae cyanobacterium]
MLHRIQRVLWQFLLVGILAIFVFLGLISISSQTGLAVVTQIKDTSI